MKMQLLAIVSALALSAGYAAASDICLDDTNGDLFAGNPVTGIFTYIGTSTRADIFDGFTDIDFTSNGNLYGLDHSGNLYIVNPNNGHITNGGSTNNSIGSTGVTNGSLVGLAGDNSGNLWAGGNNSIYTVNTSTGAATPVGTNTGTAYTVEGDLEFIGGTLYLTSTGDSGGDFYTVNTTTGVATFIGNTGFSSVYGVAYDTTNSTLYGFTASGVEFQINPSTGAGSNAMTLTFTGGEDAVNGTSNQILGAAFGANPVPEPSSVALLSIGLSTMIAAAVRRIRRV